MNYIKIKTYDTANGPGVRVTIFVAGCPHQPKCPFCFNPETYDFAGGELFTEEVKNYLLEQAKKSYISGITLLGGEPMDLRNQKGLLPYVKEFKEMCPNKTVWAYTGYKYDEIYQMYLTNDITKELLPLIDILVDDKFVNDLKDPRLVFKGSSNQTIIKIPETLSSGKIVEWTPPVYYDDSMKQ